MEATRGCSWMALHSAYTPLGQLSGLVVIIGQDTMILVAAFSSSQPICLKLAMPRRQKKAPAPQNDNEALMLLTLQQQVHQLTEARATLANVLTLLRETPLHNFTSAQDRRTLSTAQSCLDSLCIRLEAHTNTVEETVKQKQVALLVRQRQVTGECSHTDFFAPSCEGVSEREWVRPCYIISVSPSPMFHTVVLALCPTR